MPIEVAIETEHSRHILGSVSEISKGAYILNEADEAEALFITCGLFEIAGRVDVLEVEDTAPLTIRRRVRSQRIHDGLPYVQENFGYQGYIGRLSLTLIHADLN